MLSAALSASRRRFWLLAAIASITMLSFVVGGCAGVVSPSSAQSNPTPASTDLAISNVQASGATASSVQLSWTTNLPSTSAIAYGTTTAYGASTPVNSSMVTTHQIGLTSLAAGTTYHYQVRSAAGSSTATSGDQTFSTPGDTTPLSVSITSPASGSTLSGNVNLTAVASDSASVVSVQFRVDGKNVGTSLSAAPYAYVLNSTTLSNGSHTINAAATDGAGKSATSASVAVTVDNTIKDTTPPTVTITAPANGANVSGTVIVSANAADNVSVASVQLQLDGANVGAADTAAPFTFSWDTTKTSNGAHVLRAIATDGAGNSATSNAVTVTVSNAATPSTFSISGTISPTAGGAGATVTLSGTSGATITANGSGAYTFTGLAMGTYSITPSQTGFTFNPGSQSATITAANVTGVNFTATAQPAATFSISGTISPTAGGAGATVTLSGASGATATANGSGAYSFTGLAKGSYAVTPSHAGYTFSPTSQSATLTNANLTGVNFTATAQPPATFSISGTITPTSGGSGATVLLSGAAGATTTTNASGNYTFTGLANGNYTVTPSDSGFTFTPANQSVTISGVNVTGINFIAAANKPFSVDLSWSPSTSTVSGYNVYRSTVNGSGYVKLNSSLIGGTIFDDTNVQSGATYYYVTTSVDSGGDESAYSNQATAAIP